jgi:hypothetical protein
LYGLIPAILGVHVALPLLVGGVQASSRSQKALLNFV